MKYKLLRKISKIHAIKCNKSVDVAQMMISNNVLIGLMNKIDEMVEEDTDGIIAEIDMWKNTNPIASEDEINKLLKRK